MRLFAIVAKKVVWKQKLPDLPTSYSAGTDTGKGKIRFYSNRVNMETPITLDEIIAAVNKEDLLCIEIVEEIGQKLGKQIAGLINIFNPELVIIGGTLSLTGDYINATYKNSSTEILLKPRE